MDEIIQYKITKNEFIKIEHKDCYKLKYINSNNYVDYIDDLKNTIDLLHQQLDWDGIPTIKKCIERFNANSFCLLSFLSFCSKYLVSVA